MDEAGGAGGTAGARPLWSIRGRGVDSAAPGPGGALATNPVAPYWIWGIVNVTPDSFSDGGRHNTPEAALAHARALAAQGAAVLDIGGASSRPGASELDAAGEAARVMPVIRGLLAGRAAARAQDSPSSRPRGASIFPLVSVDTWRADVAEAALDAGADIINDISACVWEPRLAEVLAARRPGYVLMHCQGRPGHMQDAPRYADVVDEVTAFFERRMAALVRAGLPETNIILDPGIGFGKTPEHNLALLTRTGRLLELGRPLLLGLSRKSLFGDMFGLKPAERDGITAVATALMAERGYAHHRVHDAAAARRALALVRAVGPV
ncbi:MAG: dihydropteroate synthase [Desulfovibrionaceae bacterium]|nr:dihydropteroate synthase [Desulfovibrionaceae bacterium]